MAERDFNDPENMDVDAIFVSLGIMYVIDYFLKIIYQESLSYDQGSVKICGKSYRKGQSNQWVEYKVKTDQPRLVRSRNSFNERYLLLKTYKLRSDLLKSGKNLQIIMQAGKEMEEKEFVQKSG